MNTKHGMYGTPEYMAWQDMLKRCNNENNQAYINYGGRGISVCPEWTNSFEVFYKDMGCRPSDLHSLDRVDNDQGYDSDNCRWATTREQQRNRRTPKNNKSGQKGVCYNSKQGKWRSYISSDSGLKMLGSFESLLDAVSARKSAENLYWSTN